MNHCLDMLSQLSPLGVGLGALAIILVGSAWYSPFLFGKAYMRHTGIRSTDFTKGDAQRGYAFAIVSALVQAALVGLVVSHVKGSVGELAGAIGILWLFILIEQFNRFIWERASFSLVLIHAFRSLATLMAAAFTYHFVS